MLAVVKTYIWVLVAAAILCYQLLVPPSAGLASNGDFGRILGIFELAAPAQDENAYADIQYRFSPENRYEWGYYSTEMLFAAAAIGLNHIFSSPQTFDLRWIGCVHSLLFLAALWLLQPLLGELSRGRRLVVSAACVFIFCDVMYSTWMSSFYMDTATYVLLLLTVVFFLRAARWRRRVDAILLVVCTTFMILAKTQHAVLGCWIALAIAACHGRLWPGNTWRFTALSSLTILAVTVGAMSTGPRDYKAAGTFSVIFYQILPHSNDPVSDLGALGLDASYAKWSGTHTFSPGNQLSDPQFLEAYLAKTSYARLAWFFLTHPRHAYLALDTSLREAARQRPILGNFDRSVGLPPSAESQRFALWSDAKKAMFFTHGSRYLCFWLVVVVTLLLLMAYQRHELAWPHVVGGMALAAMALTAMLIASLADAVDVIRHHFIANALLDLLILACVALAPGWRPRVPPHAVDQAGAERSEAIVT